MVATAAVERPGSISKQRFRIGVPWRGEACHGGRIGYPCFPFEDFGSVGPVRSMVATSAALRPHCALYPASPRHDTLPASFPGYERSRHALRSHSFLPSWRARSAGDQRRSLQGRPSRSAANPQLKERRQHRRRPLGQWTASPKIECQHDVGRCRPQSVQVSLI